MSGTRTSLLTERATRHVTSNKLPTMPTTSINSVETETEPEVFTLDPFHRNINPGTTDGRILFNKETESLETSKRLNASIFNAKKV